jgi:hypothetical protein
MNFIVNGCIGSLTFGIYWHYISMNHIQENNKKIEKQRKEFLDIIQKKNECLYKEMSASIK